MKTQKKINAISLSNQYYEVFLFKKKIMLSNVLFWAKIAQGVGVQYFYFNIFRGFSEK